MFEFHKESAHADTAVVHVLPQTQLAHVQLLLHIFRQLSAISSSTENRHWVTQSNMEQ